MQRKILAGLALALVAGVSPAQGQGQRPRTVHLPSRWMFNAHSVAAFGASVTDPVELGTLRTGLGPGGGVQVGYAITPRLTAFASAEAAKQGSRTDGIIGDFKLTHLEVGARLGFPLRSESAMQPYLLATVGRRSLSTNLRDFEGNTGRIALSGLTVGVGGGVQYFLSPHLALDGGVNVGFGRFGGTLSENGFSVPVPKLERTTIARILFGVNWYH
jgi:Outer membrane protein beta-barrel domain